MPQRTACACKAAQHCSAAPRFHGELPVECNRSGRMMCRRDASGGQKVCCLRWELCAFAVSLSSVLCQAPALTHVAAHGQRRGNESQPERAGGGGQAARITCTPRFVATATPPCAALARRLHARSLLLHKSTNDVAQASTLHAYHHAWWTTVGSRMAACQRAGRSWWLRRRRRRRSSSTSRRRDHSKRACAAAFARPYHNCSATTVVRHVVWRCMSGILKLR
ncbi:hypothetical protein JKP88DRAFT_230740 [Tribonema minus]|uniref:Uncharacterized protein n=1 Tax=Tribonema minus TaxID=303371 RepID=A0A836CNG2_9STRA|nr:hypothetical protein JKP88DRAFT_230740 [Tribonema minus]